MMAAFLDEGWDGTVTMMGALRQDMIANEIDKEDGEDFKAKFTSD